MKNKCPRNFKISEIMLEYGKDDDKCNSCNNQIYNNGMITCKLAEDESLIRIEEMVNVK